MTLKRCELWFLQHMIPTQHAITLIAKQGSMQTCVHCIANSPVRWIYSGEQVVEAI